MKQESTAVLNRKNPLHLRRGECQDHYCIQRITKQPTQISLHQNQTADWFESNVRTSVHVLSYGSNTLEGKRLPIVATHQRSEMGLLVIPGRARDTVDKRPATYALRLAHETALLKEAQLIGRPVLGICAGAWTLWESFGGRLADCEEHCYRGGMPRIGIKGDVGYNVQLHDVVVKEQTMLSSIVKANREFSVNSVHWKVVNGAFSPDRLLISATAKQNDAIAPKSHKHDRKVKPDPHVVEAFETKQGVPMMGIQWHPEAYNNNATQHNIIKYMALAGVAFAQKRKVLQQIEEYGKQPNKAAFFKTRNTAVGDGSALGLMKNLRHSLKLSYGPIATTEKMEIKRVLIMYYIDIKPFF